MAKAPGGSAVRVLPVPHTTIQPPPGENAGGFFIL
jgi:hypothetical protein